VITAAVWAGMSMVDVLARISDGRWRGLASFYARYSNSTSWWEALSKFDWPNAVAYVTGTANHPTPLPRSTSRSPTKCTIWAATAGAAATPVHNLPGYS